MTDQITTRYDPEIQKRQLQALTDLESRYLFYLIALGWPPDEALDYVYVHNLVERRGTSP